MIITRSSKSKTQYLLYGLLMLLILVMHQGCAYRQPAGFIPVLVKPGDTLDSLAEKYLGDPGKSWVISDFNELASLSAGQELIIPLEYSQKGGLSVRGYQTVPILTYHNFSLTNEELMVVRKDAFEQQMKYLKENGYRVVTLDDLFDFLEFLKPLPQKAVVLTFDDGWQGVYSIAFPILIKYGFPATLFVYTDLINGSSKTLNWAQVAELERGGVDIQCHTKSHRNLIKRAEGESLEDYVADVENEITESTRIIKEKLKKEVRYLAYPYGDANNLAIAFLKREGFRGAFTVKREANPFFIDHYTLNRSMIYGTYDLQDFKKNLDVYSRKALN